MKTLITRASAHISGRRGQRQHGKIVDSIFSTRDKLDAAAVAMMDEMDSNSRQIQALRDRNKELYKQVRHAQTVAQRIAEFFLPR